MSYFFSGLAVRAWRTFRPGVYALLSAFLLMAPALSTGNAGQDPVQQATDALEGARRQQADFLSPNAFKRAEEAYQRYIALIRQGKPVSDTRAALDRFRKALDTVMKNVNNANTILARALTARSRAIEAKAETVASSEYRSAEARLHAAIGRIEGRKLADADKIGRDAAAQYRHAELAALKVGLVGLARTRLAEAKAHKADQYAPQTFGHAQALIREIETELARGGDVPEALRAKARTAEYEARHALFLSTTIDTLRRNNANWERSVLDQERIMARLAGFLGVPYRFDRNRDAIIDSMFQTIRREKEALIRQVASRDKKIAALTQQADSLRTAYNEQQIRLASMLEQYQTDLQKRKEDLERRSRELKADLKMKLVLDAASTAQDRFTRKEAQVIRKENVLTIRLIGLEFRTGKTSLPKNSLKTLDKLGKLLAEYPSSTVTVEGHTDATGGAGKNLALSKARAASVREYLTAHADIPEDRISSEGYGSTRPIANNKTRSGRAKNRRIDVRIAFEE